MTDLCPDCGDMLPDLPPCGPTHHAGCACSVARREAEVHCLRKQRNFARGERDRLERILRLTTAAVMGLDDYEKRPFGGTVDFMEHLPAEVHTMSKRVRETLVGNRAAPTDPAIALANLVATQVEAEKRRVSAVRMMRANRDDIAKLMGWTSTNDDTLTEKVKALADALPMLVEERTDG